MNKTPSASTQALTRGAIIAALYTVLTLLLAPISYGQLQIRISEALTLLPVLLPEAVPALAVGCLISNILGGATVLDVVFGTLATLAAAILTRLFAKKLYLAAMMPVLMNGLVVGFVVHIAYSPAVPLWLCMLSVAAGEAVSCFILGPIVLKAIDRIPQKLLHN